MNEVHTIIYLCDSWLIGFLDVFTCCFCGKIYKVGCPICQFVRIANKVDLRDAKMKTLKGIP